MLSAYSLARKTQKEFDAAVQLDDHNFDAQQDLIQYDCTAPGMVGGGEEKAQPLIEKLMKMDAAEGHYATGICRAQKKDYAAADAEFAKALDGKPKTANRIYDIGDYFVQRKECGKTSGGGRGRRRLGAARSPREILRGRSVDSARREARGSGKIVEGLPATCADEFRLPAPVGRALLARAAAREPRRIRPERAANTRPR